jgi:hypothetical protein
MLSLRLIRRAFKHSVGPFGPKVKNIMQISCLALFRRARAVPVATIGVSAEVKKERIKRYESDM